MAGATLELMEPEDWAKQTLKAAKKAKLDAMSRTELFLWLISSALKMVSADYYRPSSLLEFTPENIQCLPERQKEAVLKYLGQHHERVFCYELYHQIRALMEQEETRFSGVRFQGELKKYQMDADLLARFDFTALDREYIPDFLLHSPGDGDHQESVIEVKCDPSLTFEKAKYDLKKIDQFISNYGYAIGVFLTVNIRRENVEAMMDDCQSTEWIASLGNANKVFWIWKETTDRETETHRLDEFLDANAWRERQLGT